MNCVCGCDYEVVRPRAGKDSRELAEADRGQDQTSCRRSLCQAQQRYQAAGTRLRVGDWRVIYELHDDRLELWALEVGARGGDLLMRIETITRKGREFALIPMSELQKLMEDAEMLADVRAYDAAKARLQDGRDELIPLEITERRLRGESAMRVWREYRRLTQEQLAKKSKVSRALIAAAETKRKTGSVSTWKKLGAALNVSWEQLA